MIEVTLDVGCEVVTKESCFSMPNVPKVRYLRKVSCNKCRPKCIKFYEYIKAK